MARIVEPPVVVHSSPVRRLHEDGGVKELSTGRYMRNPAIAAIIRRCRAGGMPLYKIAKIVGKSPETIEKYYGEDIEEEDGSLVASITEKMAEVAQDPDHKQFVVAAKFMLSRLAPEVFAERSEHQFLIKQDQDSDGPGTVNPYDMTDEQRENLKAALMSAMQDAVNNPVIEGEVVEGINNAIEYKQED